MSLAVVGADFPNRKGPGRRFEIAMCSPGEPVSLVAEPKNPADPRAIAVFSCRGIQIGYLSAERCGLIGKFMAEGIEVATFFQAATAYGAVIRASFDGAPPELPSQPEASPESRTDPDFWPDEIYPDE